MALSVKSINVRYRKPTLLRSIRTIFSIFKCFTNEVFRTIVIDLIDFDIGDHRKVKIYLFSLPLAQSSRLPIYKF